MEKLKSIGNESPTEWKLIPLKNPQKSQYRGRNGSDFIALPEITA